MISVLLDAGAGPNWQYIDRKGIKYERSEGLAAASLDMFIEGVFSSDLAIKTRVNSIGLKELNVHRLQIGFQISENNPLIGIEGRCALLQSLGVAMENYQDYYGTEVIRPGNLYDYIMKHVNKNNEVSVKILWKALIESLESIWPSRLSGVRRGDVWTHHLLKIIGKPGSDLIPFHKLLQWLSYSLIEIFENYGNIKFIDINDFTALAEYRNGGLLIDTGLITIKDKINLQRIHDVGSELVVEWRSLTIVLIDMIANEMRKNLKLNEQQLPLPCVLEGGTWQTGRYFAKLLRNGEPPLHIRSDGTIF